MVNCKKREGVKSEWKVSDVIHTLKHDFDGELSSSNGIFVTNESDFPNRLDIGR